MNNCETKSNFYILWGQLYYKMFAIFIFYASVHEVYFKIFVINICIEFYVSVPIFFFIQKQSCVLRLNI